MPLTRLTPQEKEQIAALKSLKVFGRMNESRLRERSSNGSICIACPDCDHVHELHCHHEKVSGTQRTHRLGLNGGALHFARNCPLPRAKTKAIVLIGDLVDTMNLKNVSYACLYGHAPCGAVRAYNSSHPSKPLSVVDSIGFLVQGAERCQARCPGLVVSVFFHIYFVDDGAEQRKTYEIDIEKWYECAGELQKAQQPIIHQLQMETVLPATKMA